MKDKIIAISRMYNGDYLKQGNLGHEVINLYKSDNGNNYIYLTKSGKINKVHSGRISCVLLVRGVGHSQLEIIGKAEGIEEIYGKVDQSEYIRDKNIRYGGVFLNEMFSDNISHQEICITFKAERVVRPAKPIYIQYGDGKNNNIDDIAILYEVNQAKQSLRQYIPESCEHDYRVLADIINNEQLWGEDIGYVNTTNEREILPTTMFDICGISYSELAYSHALYHFLSSNAEFASEFVINILGIKEGLIGQYKVYREWHNIDLYIEDSKKAIIIENKIKSSINGVFIDEQKIRKDSQLDRYINIVEESTKGLEIHPYLLAPNYNKIDINKYNHSKKYTQIFYKDLYNFMHEFPAYKNDSSFKEFTKAIKRHTVEYDNELYEAMRILFLKRIEENHFM